MRTEKQKKTKERMRRAAKTALSLAVIMLLTIGFWTQPACAQEAPSGKPASLTVHFVYADKETEIPIEGAEFEIYQVGVFDETVRYVKAERFADVKVADFEELKTAAQLQEAAKRFAEAAKKQQADGVKQTDAKGEAVFARINEKGYGIYLVVQSARNGKANEFTMVEPFLINVPESTEEEYRYDVTASPKTTVERVPQSPRTGDGNVPGLWAAVLCAAAMTEAALFFSLRKKERAK